MKTLLLLACLALVLGAAGCGGDDDDESSSGGEATAEQTDTAAETGTVAEEPSGGGAATEVSMKDILYKPESVTVKTGGTVKWTNDDPIEHTVTYVDGPGEEFDSGDMPGDDTFEQTFTAAGTVNYVCTIHPNQKGKVVVE
ncbi:MAG: cupredoxin domain-containing protein [Thermoleophilaceae bacterium]|nr:cupredoxin domain-containing protein [Thermoleophilaceae bacterium]